MTRFPAEVLCAVDHALILAPDSAVTTLDAYSAMQAACYDLGYSGIPLGAFNRLVLSLGVKRRTRILRSGQRRDIYRGLAIRPMYAP
ncbi:hypothetical protein ABZV67_10785 [Streptomyces sp. NPDC005065]|uniref:hypothetical protein n=1 Tax=unclassified Streptomyces TaxID=2593676 RepID=UPI0033B8CDDE